MPIRVKLMMEAHFEPDAESYNVVGELRGRELPNEVVVVGGHFDSWDVGAGATDDGGGCIVTWEALRLMKKLNLRPRRTVRVVLFDERGERRARRRRLSRRTPGRARQPRADARIRRRRLRPVGLRLHRHRTRRRRGDGDRDAAQGDRRDRSPSSGEGGGTTSDRAATAGKIPTMRSTRWDTASTS